jgi:membrane protease subunit HflC
MASKVKKIITLVLTVIIIGVVCFFAKPFYIVDEGDQVVVIRFENIVSAHSEAGLYFKIPFIDQLETFPKRILSIDGDTKEIQTLDNLSIIADVTARWKITDPKAFYKTFIKLDSCYNKLSDIIDASCRTIITQNKLNEIVRSSNIINESETPVETEDSEIALQTEVNTTESIKIGRNELCRQMLELSQKAVTGYGIEIIDIVPRQIKYTDSMTDSVYQRMVSERKQIAQKFRSSGEGKKAEWLGKLENEKRRIESEAYTRAEKIKGDADAEAAKIYAEAYNKDPEFYTFWKSMESYKKTLKGYNATYSTKMDYFDYLYGVNGR